MGMIFSASWRCYFYSLLNIVRCMCCKMRSSISFFFAAFSISLSLWSWIVTDYGWMLTLPPACRILRSQKIQQLNTRVRKTRTNTMIRLLSKVSYLSASDRGLTSLSMVYMNPQMKNSLFFSISVSSSILSWLQRKKLLSRFRWCNEINLPSLGAQLLVTGLKCIWKLHIWLTSVTCESS